MEETAMRFLRSVLPASLLLICGCATALAAETAPPPANGPAAVPDDGLRCVTDQGVEEPSSILDDAILIAGGGGGGVPNGPVNFNDCHDLPGQACTPINCATVDLGYNTCKKPGGRKISCTNGNLQQTTCDCHAGVRSTCCDEPGGCSFGDCGICGTGLLSTVCPL
jgi:hypothetical protein